MVVGNVVLTSLVTLAFAANASTGTANAADVANTDAQPCAANPNFG
jgi:hypothetical protein